MRALHSRISTQCSGMRGSVAIWGLREGTGIAALTVPTENGRHCSPRSVALRHKERQSLYPPIGRWYVSRTELEHSDLRSGDEKPGLVQIRVTPAR